MSVRRSLIVFTLIALALPVFTYGNRTAQFQAQAQQTAAQNLQLYTVVRGDVETVISAIGAIEAEAVSDVSMTVAGRVETLYVEEGAYVLTGDPLFSLDADVQTLAVAQAELAVEAAQLSLQDVVDGPDEDDIRIAQANLDSAWSAYNAVDTAISGDDIAAAQLRVEQAEEAYRAANEARRVAGGDDPELITLLDAEIGEASFNLEIARQQLSQLEEGDPQARNVAYARVVQAQAALEQAQAGATAEQIDQAEVSVEQAMTNLEQAQADLAKMTLIAPFDGVISDLLVEVGSRVVPGAPVVQMYDIEPMHVTVNVDEIDVRRVAEGLPANIEVDALDEVVLPASVQRVAVVGTDVDGITNYPVEITLTERDPRVLVGMTTEANIIVDSAENVLVVPNEFVRLDRRRGSAFVERVQADGTLAEVEIELGLQGVNQSEVLNGIGEGDVIAVNPEGEAFSFFGGG